LLGGLRVGEDRDLVRRFEREILVLEALQENRRVLDDILRPLPDAVAATVDDDFAGSIAPGLGCRRLAAFDLLVGHSAHILSKGLRTRFNEASRRVFD